MSILNSVHLRVEGFKSIARYEMSYSSHKPGESKALLNRADRTGIYTIDHDALSKEILAQKEQEPFWRVKELQPPRTKFQPAV